MTKISPWLDLMKDTSSTFVPLSQEGPCLPVKYRSITPYMSIHEMSAADVVSHLRAAVEAETGLTISAGIAPNKLLAKICSDKNKPDGQFELVGDAKVVKAFMRDLPIRRVPGVGRVAERILSSMGVQVRSDVHGRRRSAGVLTNSCVDMRRRVYPPRSDQSDGSSSGIAGTLKSISGDRE